MPFRLDRVLNGELIEFTGSIGKLYRAVFSLYLFSRPTILPGLESCLLASCNLTTALTICLCDCATVRLCEKNDHTQ